MRGVEHAQAQNIRTQFVFFMAFSHNRNFICYPKGTIFSREQLLQIKPQHVYNWLANKAFKKVDFSVEGGDKPIHARSLSLKFQKKAISYFMPDNAPHWYNGHGNPTKHQMHCKLIDVIKNARSAATVRIPKKSGC